jgi:hypothetical protein
VMGIGMANKSRVKRFALSETHRLSPWSRSV